MEYDYNAMNEKKAELVQVVEQGIPPGLKVSDSCVQSLMESFVRITPPAEPKQTFRWITVNQPDVGGGSSRKPGNVVLSWRKLMDLVPDVAIAAVGGLTSPPWLLPFIGLYVWNKFWCSSEEPLTEVEATVIYALWKNRNGQNKIPEDDGFEKSNGVRKGFGQALLSRQEFGSAVNRLVKMHCIEIEEGIIWLRESVSIKY